MPVTGWNFIGSRFYLASGSTPGPVSDGSWTDMGFSLAAYAGYPLLVGMNGGPQFKQGSIGSWSNTVGYAAGAVVFYNGSGSINPYIYVCILGNTGFAPFNTTYWSTAWPGAGGPGGSVAMNFQWSSTVGTLTPITGSPMFGVPFGSLFYDETGVGHSSVSGVNPTPVVPVGAVTLFAEVPTGLAASPFITSFYQPFSLYYYYQPEPNIEVLENLYGCNGVFDHSAARGDVLKSLIGSCSGCLIPPGDEWHLFAGAYNPPTTVLTDADLRDTIKGDFRISRRDICNGVKGTFIPSYLPTNQTQAQPSAWRWTDFPPYQGNGLQGHPNYIAEDGGAIIWKEARFGFCTSIWMVQRLAKITLQLLRFQVTLHLACKLTAFAVQAGDTVTFIHARWAALANPPPTTFFVTQATLVVENTEGAPALAVDLVLREHDPSIYEFTAPSSPTNQGEYSAYGSLGVI
jgi:hypothetical protein